MRARDFIDETKIYMMDDGGLEFPDSRMLVFLKDALRDISGACRCIREQFAISLVAGQARYGLMDNFASLRLVMFKYPEGWLPLEKGTLDEIEILNGGAVTKNTYPEVYDLWDKSHIEKLTEGTIVEASTVGGLTFVVEGNIQGLRAGDLLINLTDANAQGMLVSSNWETINNEPRTRIEYTLFVGGGRDQIQVGDRVGERCFGRR